LAQIHRLNGYLSMLFILLHPILLIFSYAIIGKVGFFSQLGDFIFNEDELLKAAIAVLLFIAIVFLSIHFVRKHVKYETWYFVHLLTYLAVILAFGHQLSFGGDFLSNKIFVYYWYFLYAFILGNFIFSRFITPLWNAYRYRFSVDHTVSENGGATSVYIKGKNLESWKASPGQFISLRFLTKNFWWQSHPFSLSAIPKNDQLRVTVKNLGDFTSKVSNLTKNTPVLIEGPYGTFTAKSAPKTKYFFIAGGVGITPIRTLAEKLASTNNLIIFYSNKTSKDIIFRKELDELSQKYHFPIHYIMSNEENYSGEKGRIDKEKLMRLVPDLKDREVYICGPTSMMECLSEMLQELGLKTKHIHYEKFGW